MSNEPIRVLWPEWLSHGKAETSVSVEARLMFTEVGPNAAQSMRDIAERRFAVPAKQATARTSVIAASIVGIVGSAIAFDVPPHVIKLMMVGVFALASTVAPDIARELKRRKDSDL